MTSEKLVELLGGPADELIKGVQEESVSVPAWSDLEKEYDPMKHAIWDTTVYPPKLNENGIDELKRTALPLQKLAVSRISQSMFSTPVERVYSYDKDSESQQETVDMLELLYRTNNSIDSENIERGKKLNASCQIATVWKVLEKPAVLPTGEVVKYTLAHKTYSAMDGYTIYIVKDDSDYTQIASFMYKDKANKEYCDMYINNLEKYEFRRYVKLDNWVLDTTVSKTLEVFPVVAMSIPEPVWGGEAGTNLVEQLEEMESFDGLYIKRNASPTFTLDYGELQPGSILSSTTEKSNDSRRIIEVGKGGSMTDVTWNGAAESLTNRYHRIRNSFFEQVQMPDISFSNLINSNTSAENKELLFSDAKAKAIDLGGEWIKMFHDELMIIKQFMKIIIPKYAKELDSITIRSVIKPYSIKTSKENAEFVAVGGGSMSLATRVRVLGAVDDVEREVSTIEEEQAATANQF